ncbi:MAG TPA: DUF3052 domain-containing protein [Dermatophilaceae bacterium]|nr:DUF3052 domain-containing protein [Dermatophilaceae bacterium]
MSTPAPPPATSGPEGGGGASTVERLGFAPGQVVQEFGYDEDVADDFRFRVEDLCGTELEDEDYTGEADAVLLWWRDGDGDLADALVDMVGILGELGFVVLLTPKPGRDGEVDASEVDESAVTTGLHASGTFSVGGDWRATKLVAPKAQARHH